MATHKLIEQDFSTVAAAIGRHAAERPRDAALHVGAETLDLAALDAAMDRVAASFQRDGLAPGDVVAICAATSMNYACVYLGAIRAGLTVAPLPPYATPDSLSLMIADAGAAMVFADAEAIDRLKSTGAPTPRTISLDGSPAARPFADWLAAAGTAPAPVAIDPRSAFNIIYSSGTTGVPKGIVQSYAMRWVQAQRASNHFSADVVTILATLMCSNLTLTIFFQTLAHGGAVILMPKFDPEGFLRLIEQRRATLTMMVPNQYLRVMALPNFSAFDLTSMRMKYCASAPFPTALKAEVVKRFPGALVEFYGMTEGGGVTMLAAHDRPDKLSTVGRPFEGHDMRVIDENGAELPRGSVGEVVGRSTDMMTGYHNHPEKTAEAEWHDREGRRFIRTGDIGWFDEEGFLTLVDRRKDMIISGGLNIYSNDLEDALLTHDAVSEAAVVGAPSERWGETPVGFVVLKSAGAASGEELREFANQRLGKMQRLERVHVIDALPRNPLGKVLKRDLRQRLAGSPAA
jgi:acyl-CoA synthetase (AMP-forming)/AMP-acid ligase II